MGAFLAPILPSKTPAATGDRYPGRAFVIEIQVDGVPRSASAPVSLYPCHILAPHLSSTRPSAASNPEGRSSPPGGRSGSLPQHPTHPPAAVDEAEGWSGLDLGLFAYSGGAMVGILPEIQGLIDSMGTAEKAAFYVAAVAAIVSVGFGLMTAGYRGLPVSRSRELSAFCARCSTVTSTALFITATSCKFGRIGCVAGVSSATVVASIMTSVCIYERWAADAVSSSWGRLWRRREPAAAQSVQLARPQV